MESNFGLQYVEADIQMMYFFKSIMLKLSLLIVVYHASTVAQTRFNLTSKP